MENEQRQTICTQYTYKYIRTHTYIHITHHTHHIHMHPIQIECIQYSVMILIRGSLIASPLLSVNFTPFHPLLIHAHFQGEIIKEKRTYIDINKSSTLPFYFFQTTWQISTRLCTTHLLVNRIQVSLRKLSTPIKQC